MYMKFLDIYFTRYNVVKKNLSLLKKKIIKNIYINVFNLIVDKTKSFIYKRRLFIKSGQCQRKSLLIIENI